MLLATELSSHLFKAAQNYQGEFVDNNKKIVLSFNNNILEEYLMPEV